MLIEQILGSIDGYDLEKYNKDPLIMDHEMLAKPHQKAITSEGRDIAISLPRGEQLYYGAVLYDEDNVLIYVEMADEELLEVYPEDNMEWGRTAFNIGNMHHPAYINETSIKTPYDPNIERIIKALNVRYEKKSGKLTGKKANVDQHKAHSHSHGHSHDHSHSSHGDGNSGVDNG